jgi:predicted acyltransferase
MTSPKQISSAARPGRQISVDVYRGMVMFLMLAEMLHLSHAADKFPGNKLLEWLQFHTSHVAWEGCSLHDLIQPGFTFLVGVAMPFSIASRMKRSQSTGRMLLHAAWRSVLLIGIGIALRSMDHERTNFTFEDTLTQIGMGYFFVFLIALAPRWVHYASTVAILAGFWAAFALSSAPPADFDYPAVGVAEDWPHHHDGFASRWNKNSNLSWQVDQWFMNLFPPAPPFDWEIEEGKKDEAGRFIFNGGGYSTLSFVPTMATMLFGLIAGLWLKEPLSNSARMTRFLIAIAIGLGAGWALAWSDLCPMVKRIWTPSFALFSGGWCMLWLLVLHVICDLRGWKTWAYPFLVLGANSILIYVMSWTVETPIKNTLYRHFGTRPFAVFGEPYTEVVSGAVTLLIMFGVLLWLYRRKVFIRI